LPLTAGDKPLPYPCPAKRAELQLPIKRQSLQHVVELLLRRVPGVPPSGHGFSRAVTETPNKNGL